MAECIATGGTTGTLQGICPDCDRMIYRRINPQNLDAVRGDLDVTVTRARLRIKRVRSCPCATTGYAMKDYYSEAEIDQERVALRAQRWESFKVGLMITVVFGIMILWPIIAAFYFDNAAWLWGWTLFVFFMS